MRLVICADVHFDSVFPLFRNNPRKTRLRQEEQRIAFSKAINEAKKTDAHLLLIPGDLFSSGKISQETVNFLIDSFNSIPDTLVVITPGNNDPVSDDSIYSTVKWPENVYVFKRGLEALELSYGDSEEKVRLYGAAFQGHSCKKSLLRQNNTLPILDDSFINLLVMHGTVCEDGEKSDCNPIYIKDLNTCGFDFCAFGHIHKFSDVVKTPQTSYAYIGPCEGRGFSESGTCGILSGSVTKDSVEMNFIKTSVRENNIVKVDISGLDSHEAILDKIRSSCPNPEFIYKIILVGKKNGALNLSVAKLMKELSSNYFYVKVSAEYQEDVNIELLKNENSLRGCFVRCMAEKMESAENPDLLYEALCYGLQSFESEVHFNDNP